MNKAAFCLSALLTVGTSHAEMPRVVVGQWRDHPALQATARGLNDELAGQGFHSEKLQLTQRDLQNSPALAQQWASEQASVLVALATPAAEAARATSKNPVVFAAVSNPQALTWHAANLAGIINDLDFSAQIAMIRRLLPHAHRIGIIYNPQETQSRVALQALQKEAPKKGLTLISAPARTTADVRPAVQSLSGKIDAFYIPLDNTAASAFADIITISKTQRLPVFTADPTLLAQGALAALGHDYETIGHLAGQQVARILRGENPADIGIVPFHATELQINPTVAHELGLTMPAQP